MPPSSQTAESQVIAIQSINFRRNNKLEFDNWLFLPIVKVIAYSLQVREVLLEKFESKRKSVHVVEQLLDAIKSKSYRVGDKLPSELVIAEQTGVSRPSVREALGALRLVGILETRMGDGTYVKDVSWNKVDDSPYESQVLLLLESGEGNPFEALEARRTVEIDLVKYAAERRTSKNLRDLKLALDRIISSTEALDFSELLNADEEFHLVIGRAATNSVLERVLTFLLDVMKQSIWPRLKRELLVSSKQHLEETAHTHLAIYNTIKERDSEKAAKVMAQHFDEIEMLFRE